MKINPYFYEDLLRLLVYNIEDKLFALDVGRTLPNTDLSRDFMGPVVDLGTHIWHPQQIFLQGRMTLQRERAWDRDWPGDIQHTPNLRLLLVLKLLRYFVKQKRPGVKTLTRKQNKQTIHLFLSVQNRQNEKS